MAHPDIELRRIARIFLLDSVQQPGRARPPDFCVAELAMTRWSDATAELGRHGLHAITDAEHWHTLSEYRFRRARRLGIRHRLGPSRQDDSAGAKGPDRFIAGLPRQNLAVDTELAHAPRDQLGVLGPEIENQDPMGVDVGAG